MKIKIKAPEGYKYKDSKTGKEYSEIIIEDKQKNRFVLVPSTTETIEY